MVWLELHAMDAERNTPASLRSASTARLSVPGSEKFTTEGRPAVARVHDDVGVAVAQRADHMRAQGRSALECCRLLGMRDARGLGEAGDKGQRLGARAQPALLSAAERRGEQPGAAPHVQRADALRTAHLVRAERQQVGVQLVHVEGQLPERLHRVGVHERPARFSRAADGAATPDDVFDREAVPQFALHAHHRGQHYVGNLVQYAIKSGKIELAVASVQVKHRPAVALEAAHRFRDRRVFERGRDHRPRTAMIASVRRARSRDGEVVRLRAARGEIDLVGKRAHRLSHDRAALVEQRPCCTPFRMLGRRISVRIAHDGGNRLDHARMHRRGRRVVQINFSASMR